ncbi:hypothetical protein RB195_020003 [Necator americanus]
MYAALAAAVVNQIDKFVLVPLGVFFLVSSYTIVIVRVFTFTNESSINILHFSNFSEELNLSMTTLP